MNSKILSMLVFIVAVFSLPSFAASPTEVFSTCLVDTLNGKERKSLAKWIFLSMAAHPEIKSFSNANAEQIEQSDKYVGKLITRLLTDDCAKELKAAIKSDPLSVEKGFELVGQVAMQELMANQDTMVALTRYIQYTDQEKINKTLSK